MAQLIPPQIKQHPFEYLALFIVLLIPAFFFFLLSGNPSGQRRMVYLAAASYFLWSLYHHYRRGDLEVSIVVEYLAMALLGVILLTSTLVQ